MTTSFTAEEVVAALYGGILDRVAEPAGLAHHVALLEEGFDLSLLVRAVRTSTEMSQRLLHSTDLAALGPSIWRASGHRAHRQVYFLHIMKTGGTALTRAMTGVAGSGFCLTQIFLDHLAVMPRLALERASLVVGHLGTEALEFMGPGTAVVAVLRDPVERTLSHYAHVLADPALTEETRGLTLEEFVYEPRWRPLSANFQARNLVHRVGAARAWADFDPEEALRSLGPARPRAWSLPLQALFELSPLGLSEPELAEAGRARLDSIDLVGVAEDLDEVYTAVAPLWGAREVAPVPRLNVSDVRLGPADTPPSLRRAIAAANAVDLELYERAREIVAQRHHLASRARTVPGPDEAPATDPAPAPEAPDPPDPTRRPWGMISLLGVVLVVLIAAADALVGGQVVLIGALVAGPCCALAARQWRPAAAAGALAVALAVGLGAPDGIWGIGEHLALVALVVAVSALAVAGASVAEQRDRAACYAGAGAGERERPDIPA